jgi:spermidine synthase
MSAAIWTALLWASAGASAVRAQTPAALPAEDCTSDNLLAGGLAVAEGVVGDVALITDGVVVPEGATWDAPQAVRLIGAETSLTFDLGRSRSVSALYIQADANDVYRISASRDGAPGSFEPITEIENVVDQRGHGLRSRTLSLPAPVKVRYLRLADARGDGFFSLSELAAYCKTGARFPPEMAVATSPEQPGAGRDDSPARIEREATERARSQRLLLAAGVLLLVGVGWELVRRLRRSRAAPGIAAASVRRAALSTHDLLRLMFLASGCAALIYEVVWLHLLRLVIGASALSVGIVLASFMGGMFIGSLSFARMVPRSKNPLRVYAWLELGIAAFGVVMPLVLPAVRSVYIGLVGYGMLGIVLRALIAAALLLPPTALMGATLPAIARRYGQGRRGTSGLGALYAANTFGAVAGCLLSGFYLLAVFDVWVATFVAVALNVLIGLFALRVARREPGSPALPDAPQPASRSALGSVAPPGAGPRVISVVYLAAGLSGMTALGAQVVWTRVLTLLFGATVYAFAIILAVFLLALGVGGTAAAYLLRRGQHALRGLALTQLALVPALLFSGQLLANVLPFSSPLRSTPVGALHVLHVLRALDVIFPAALLWGMSFPFALAAAANAHEDTGRSSGAVYAANTLGAIVGAVAISFWIIPAWGTQFAQQALVLSAAISAAAAFYALRQVAVPPAGAPSREPARTWIGPASLGLFVLASGSLVAALLPGLSTTFLAHGRHIWWVDPRDRYLYVSEGAASTVAVHVAPTGYRNFHVSGRVEASNNPNDMRLERLLGHLSMLAHPHPETVLVVGLGAGITAGALTLHPEVKRIVICEIEPRVAGAARQFSTENYGVLSDPRVELVVDDARHFLATTRERFDVITSDPIHPWVRGNSVLFSREYYEIVKSKLKPGGIATQWVPLYDTSEQAIKIQMRTFADAFAQGTVWNSAITRGGYDVVMLGRREPLQLDLSEIARRMAQSPRVAESLRQVSIGSAVDLLATYGTRVADMQAWFANTPVNRDFSLKLEYISGLALNQQEADPIYENMTRAHKFPEHLFVGPPEQLAQLRRRILGGQ